MNLRKKLIRLAHAKPELRDHLLPLLKSAEENLRPHQESIYNYLNDGDYYLYPKSGGEMDKGTYDRRSNTVKFHVYFTVENTEGYQQALDNYGNTHSYDKNYTEWANNFDGMTEVSQGSSREVVRAIEDHHLYRSIYEIKLISSIDIDQNLGIGDAHIFVGLK